MKFIQPNIFYNSWIKPNQNTEAFHRNGGFFKHFQKEEIEKVERVKKNLKQEEKTSVDFELAKKMLEEYPKTKWFARIGFIIGIILIILELIRFLIELKSKD